MSTFPKPAFEDPGSLWLDPTRRDRINIPATSPPEQSPTESVNNFRRVFLGYDEQQAIAEATRCIHCPSRSCASSRARCAIIFPAHCLPSNKASTKTPRIFFARLRTCRKCAGDCVRRKFCAKDRVPLAGTIARSTSANWKRFARIGSAGDRVFQNHRAFRRPVGAWQSWGVVPPDLLSRRN